MQPLTALQQESAPGTSPFLPQLLAAPRSFRYPHTPVDITNLSVEKRAVLSRIAGYYRVRVLWPPQPRLPAGPGADTVGH